MCQVSLKKKKKKKRLQCTWVKWAERGSRPDFDFSILGRIWPNPLGSLFSFSLSHSPKAGLRVGTAAPALTGRTRLSVSPWDPVRPARSQAAQFHVAMRVCAPRLCGAGGSDGKVSPGGNDDSGRWRRIDDVAAQAVAMARVLPAATTTTADGGGATARQARAQAVVRRKVGLGAGGTTWSGSADSSGIKGEVMPTTSSAR